MPPTTSSSPFPPPNPIQASHPPSLNNYQDQHPLYPSQHAHNRTPIQTSTVYKTLFAHFLFLTAKHRVARRTKALRECLSGYIKIGNYGSRQFCRTHRGRCGECRRNTHHRLPTRMRKNVHSLMTHTSPKAYIAQYAARELEDTGVLIFLAVPC